jgi:AraC-like DNA-binding protein
MTDIPIQNRTALDRFEVLRTTSVETLRQSLARKYTKPRLEPLGDRNEFQAQINTCKLTNITLSYARFSAQRMILPHPHAFMQAFLLRGNASVAAGRTAAPVRANETIVLTPSEHNVVCVDGDYERLGLVLKPEPLIKMLSAMIGTPINRNLRMEPFQCSAGHAAQRLSRLLFHFVDELSNAAAPMPLRVLGQVEQALMIAFLCGNRHNYSHLLEPQPPSASPWQVRRAEEYIEANWDKPIRIEDIAAVTGASGRSLYRTFGKSRGYSPMDFVRLVRLRHAGLMLHQADEQTTVTQVAHACGFGDLSRFSRDYRRSFGERPSETLHRRKGNLSSGDKPAPDSP